MLKQKFQKKLKECNKCPFEDYEINCYNKNTGYGKLGAHIYPKSDNSIMVVGQNPSYCRQKGSHSMGGKQGDIFREIFGIKHLVFTNFIQISTPDNKVNTLTDKQIKHCIEHLLFEINELKPKIIIICSFFAKNKLIALNSLNKFTKTGSNIFFLKHPDYYITYHKGNINEYYEEIKEIKKIWETL